jgi:pyrroline-5-carboxylate reductase
MSDFAFIGAGNMASSLIGGLIRGGVSAATIVAADPDEAQLLRVAGLGVTVTNDNTEAIAGASAVVLAVKPQVAESVVRGFAATLDRNQLLVSIAAGVNTETLRSWAGGHPAIVRCMPNTPALFGAGITAAYADQSMTEPGTAIVDALMAAAGTGLWVNDETALDAVTAVSGSGPAYFFYLMESMIEAGVQLGLDEDVAQALTLETAKGAAIMALQSDDPPAVLRRNVTSPGGTTERAISIFEASHLHDIIVRAVKGAGERSAELAIELAAARDGDA